MGVFELWGGRPANRNIALRILITAKSLEMYYF